MAECGARGYRSSMDGRPPFARHKVDVLQPLQEVAQSSPRLDRFRRRWHRRTRWRNLLSTSVRGDGSDKGLLTFYWARVARLLVLSRTCGGLRRWRRSIGEAPAHSHRLRPGMPAHVSRAAQEPGQCKAYRPPEFTHFSSVAIAQSALISILACRGFAQNGHCPPRARRADRVPRLQRGDVLA